MTDYLTDYLLVAKQRMIVRRSQIYTFLFLALVTFQPGCKTDGPVPPGPQGGPEAEKAKSTAKTDAQAHSKSGAIDQEPKQDGKPSGKPKQTERFPESIVSAPVKEMASARIAYDTLLMERPPQAGWQYRQDRKNQIVGFEFSNRGGNRILPPRYDIGKNLLFTRDFQFRFDDRARQDIQLFVSDWAAARDKQFRLSEIMNSVLHFFPRNYLPAISTSGARYVVTLPTGEQVEFDAQSREILSGAFSETAVDLNPDRAARQFPGVHYLGKGVLVRANARGTDPRIGTTATITTGTTGSDCEKGMDCNQCQVPSKELWHQNGAVRFKFSTDEEFDRYLLARCGFGIPGKSATAFSPEPFLAAGLATANSR
ncbi:MAG TPA: hypothetical protein VEG60_30265 [Candidatus Binatia bacterium]|nr:hypothetical protein [Candidatus Binatia bacterium]